MFRLTIDFWTEWASRDHFAMAYSFAICFFVLTTQSAKVRFRAVSDMLGILSRDFVNANTNGESVNGQIHVSECSKSSAYNA